MVFAGDLRVRKLSSIAVALALSVGFAAGCGASDEGGSSSDSNAAADSADSGGSGEAKQIALLLPQNGVPRFEKFDRPLFEKAVAEKCPDCEVLYYNAGNEDAGKQQQQAEAALLKGADVLVIQAADGKAAKVIADQAAAKDVPVVAYERSIFGSDNVKAYATFDNFTVGQLQGETLLKGLEEIGHPKGPIVMINGAPTDSLAAIFRDGAQSKFDEAGAEVIATFDTPGWDPAKAQSQMDQWITKFGKDGFYGVYAANGGTAGGAIAAMKAGGLDLSQKLTTGQDADLVEIQRILAGEQYMTVYKPITKQASAAADLAVKLANGEELPEADFDGTTDMEAAEEVPTIKIDVVAVTRDNIKDTVVKDGFYTVDEICTGQYKAACDEIGLS